MESPTCEGASHFHTEVSKRPAPPAHVTAVTLLREAFGSVEVLTETPPAGSFRHLPAALSRARELGGVDGSWTDEPRLASYLAVADAVGAIEVHDAAVPFGFAWAPCSVCGEVLLRDRAEGGRTASGKVSTAVPPPVACKFTWTRVTEANITTTERCPGKHVAE